MVASGVTCHSCGMMQMARPTCKSCGAALGVPVPFPGPPRGEITERRRAPEAREAREADRVPERRWECGCGVTNAAGRKRCSGCGLRYADAMYHTQQAEQYGYSPTLRENRLSYWDRYVPTDPSALLPYPLYSPLVEVIRDMSAKERAGDSGPLGQRGRVILYLASTYLYLLVPYVLMVMGMRDIGFLVSVCQFVYAIATFPASLFAFALQPLGTQTALMLVWLLLPLINVGLLYGFFKRIRPSRD